MRGLDAFGEPQRLQVGGSARLEGVDLGADFLGVGLVQQLGDRILDEIRIAERSVAVDIGIAHRLDHQMHRLGGAVAEIGERIAFQHVEDFADDDAAGGRRRRGDDVIAAIVALDRLRARAPHTVRNPALARMPPWSALALTIASAIAPL